MRIHTKLGAALGALVLTFGITSIGFAGSQGFNGAGVRSQVDQGCGVEPLDVELILDASGSMQSNSSNGKTRMAWAKLSAKQLVESLDNHGGVGASGAHHVGVSWFKGSDAGVALALGGSDADAVKAAIDGLVASGSTPLQEGMEAGAGDMASNGRGSATHILILLSDGRPNPDQGPNGTWANSASGQRPTSGEGSAYLGSGDVVISVALGTGGNGASALDLALMALLGPDGAYHVVNGGELPDVFESIYEQIACPTEVPPSFEQTQAAETDVPVESEPVETEPVSEPPASEPVESEPVSEPPPSFEQSQEGLTDAPSEPNTATLGGNGTSAPADGAWLLVVALGVLLASIVVLTPAPARRRK